MSPAEKLFVDRNEIEVISCRFDMLRQLAQKVVEGDEGDAVAIGQAIHDLAAHYSDEAEKLIYSSAVKGLADGG